MSRTEMDRFYLPPGALVCGLGCGSWATFRNAKALSAHVSLKHSAAPEEDRRAERARARAIAIAHGASGHPVVVEKPPVFHEVFVEEGTLVTVTSFQRWALGCPVVGCSFETINGRKGLRRHLEGVHRVGHDESFRLVWSVERQPASPGAGRWGGPRKTTA